MRFFLIILSFLITALGQPAWISSFGLLAAAFGYAIFWNGMLAFSKMRTQFFIAWGWYAAVQGVQLSWIATTDYMGPLIIPFYFFLILGMGLQFAILSSLIRDPLSLHKCLAIAGGWVICEWVRLFFLCGCTWNPVGLALACSSYSLQFASIWGIFGLSFWVIFVNLLLLKKRLALWASMVVFPTLFGFLQQTWIEKTVPFTKTLNVALVQTRLAPEEKEFDPKRPNAYIHPLDQWETLLNAIKDKPSDLIVFPEAALPLGAHTASYELQSIKHLFPESFFPPLRRPYAVFYNGSWKVSNAFIAQTLANQSQAHIIIGLDDRDLTGKYNAAFHFYPEGKHVRYEKQILAPIGEYVPLQGVKWFARFVAEQFGIESSFDSGKEGKIFHSHVPIGISICLEETFSNLIRDLRLKGAELLVSVSNDAYFPNTKLAQQHFHHGRVRAAENGVPLLRSCNAGITGGVDCFGKPIQILDAKKVDALFLSFPVRSYKTLYTYWGNSAILTLSALFITSFLLAPKKKKLP